MEIRVSSLNRIVVHVITVCWSQPDEIGRRSRVHRRHKLWIRLARTTTATHNVRTVGGAGEACEREVVVAPRTSILTESVPSQTCRRHTVDKSRSVDTTTITIEYPLVIP